MIRRILISALSLLAFIRTVSAQDGELPFRGGERMLYTVHYKFAINADLATLDLSCKNEAVNGRSCIHVTGNVKSLPFWDKFYKVRDLYECSFTNDLSMLPVMYHRDVREAKYLSKNWYRWAEEGTSVKVNIDKTTLDSPVDTVFDEGAVLRDFINVIYCCRKLDFSKTGSVERILVVADYDILEARVRVIGREKKKAGEAGTFNTVKIGVAILPYKSFDKVINHSGIQLGVASEEGEYYGDEKIFVWYTDDDNRMPVLFSSPLKVGAIYGRLTEYSGNKYPLRSRTDE
ncbi:MAG: DUF3108 domain-containing protein [Bacteroidales bacterium]|nr:DUF3108 domain-containing protein [Candidatus Cacconaster merdequi]